MQRYLTLIRHAKSSWKTTGQADFQRPLNDRGKRDLCGINALLSGLPSAPGRVLASPAQRVRATVEGLVSAFPDWASRISFESDLYEASLADILRLVGTTAEGIDHVMLVGHNPGLEMVARVLDPTFERAIPTLGVVCISSEAATWDSLSLAPAAVRLFTSPKALR